MTHEMLCPVCNEGQLHSDKTINRINVANGIAEVIRCFHWCDACGVEIALDKDARANSREALQASRKATGRMTGAQIRSLREDVLKISQVEAGKIFGGGPVAFSKYENNDVPPSDAMDNLLWLICNHATLAFELAARADVPLKRPSLRTSVSKMSPNQSQILAQEIRTSQLNAGVPVSARAKFVEDISQGSRNYRLNFDWHELKAA